MKLSNIFSLCLMGTVILLWLHQLGEVVLFSTSEGVGNMLLGVPSYVYTFGQL